MEVQQKQSWFDRPLAELLRPNWEKAIYVAILLIAVVTRFWDLGARAMSHDESLHALYSYYLYSGSGYVHNPMMHGPFLFHANALIYFLFGDTDYTARIVPALFGVFMVMSPLLLRRWLGRLGAIITSFLLLISPSFLYYSRYIRNDIYITVWTVLLVAALFHFVRSRQPRWFYLGAAVLMLSLATKENAYIFGFIGLIFIVELLLWERSGFRGQLWLYLGTGVLSILFLIAALVLGQAGQAAEVAEAAEPVTGGMKLLVSTVVVLAGTLPAVLISASLIRPWHPRTEDGQEGDPGGGGRMVSSVEEAVRSLNWQQWLVALLIMFLIFALLFTTFFTNPLGLGTGIFGSISYWLAQQEVERGSQPWYYYLLLLPMYGFLPLFFSLVATVYYLVRGVRPGQEGDDHRESASPREDARFVSFLVFWSITTLFIYSWAGEKMPWLMVHPALPLVVLSGKFLGDFLAPRGILTRGPEGRLDWRAVWQRGGGLLAILLPVTLFGFYTLIKLRPFQGLSLFNLQETGNWLAALLVTLLLLVLTGLVMRRLGRRYSLLVGVAALAILLSFFTVRFAWMASFINYDYATELLVYAHGGADVKSTMDEIAKISERTVGDKMIKVAYDNDVSWPLEWYMRQYPNRVFYSDTPNREKLDVPIVLAGDKNDATVQPYLGERYHRFKRRLVWWPNQQYMDLTWERIWEILTLPEKRESLWKILYYREYPRTPDDWYHVHNFYLYIRKDVAQQIWDFGAAPPEVIELPPDPYLEAHTELNAILTWGGVGVENGQFNHPRGLAIGPQGYVYVVDSDNHRVQAFDSQGNWLHSWGSNCNLTTGHGCQDPDGSGPLELGDGQFQEPWGIAVDGEGYVYVADTWNHRIQVFDPDGTFSRKWGLFGESATDAAIFYGPRDIAVDASGRILVTDTGNERIVAFDRRGNYLGQWGQEGVGSGYFAEPVGLTVDPEGNIYVADTWNGRIQVFGPDFVYLSEWPVDGWYGQSVLNKPYLAADGQGRIYATDPEGYRVAVFDSQGQVLATFGSYGFEANSFSLPTGIDLDAAGYIYVTDTDGHRVLKFEPLP